MAYVQSFSSSSNTPQQAVCISPVEPISNVFASNKVAGFSFKLSADAVPTFPCSTKLWNQIRSNFIKHLFWSCRWLVIFVMPRLVLDDRIDNCCTYFLMLNGDVGLRLSGGLAVDCQNQALIAGKTLTWPTVLSVDGIAKRIRDCLFQSLNALSLSIGTDQWSWSASWQTVSKCWWACQSRHLYSTAYEAS